MCGIILRILIADGVLELSWNKMEHILILQMNNENAILWK